METKFKKGAKRIRLDAAERRLLANAGELMAELARQGLPGLSPTKIVSLADDKGWINLSGHAVDDDSAFELKAVTNE